MHPERFPWEVRVCWGLFFLVNHLLLMVILVWWYASKYLINRTVLQEGKAMMYNNASFHGGRDPAMADFRLANTMPLNLVLGTDAQG